MRKDRTMNISELIGRARTSVDKRRRYHRLVNEIEAMTNRDIADFGGDRGQMLHDAYRTIYG